MAGSVPGIQLLVVESLAAHSAPEPVLARVFRQMASQCLALLEDFTTIVTGEALAFVAPHVIIVMRPNSETPSTLSTEERVISGVMLHVQSQ